MKRTPFPTRRHPLRRQSRQQARQQRQQRRAYREAEDAEQGFCSVCGAVGETEHMHLYTQRQRPDLRSEPLNWLVVGKWCGCHRQQEHDKAGFAAAHPAAWQLILSRMRQLDPLAYEYFRMKNPY